MDQATLKDLQQKFPFTLASDDGLTIITAPIRLLVCNLDKPTAPPNTTKEKRYNIYAAVPHGVDWSVMLAAGKKAWAESQWAGQQPSNIPFKGPDKMIFKKTGKPMDGAEGMQMAFNSETKTPTQIFDRHTNPDGSMVPLAVDKIYAGAWVRVKVRAQAYNIGNQSGVKFWLQAVQFAGDDKRLSNGGDASAGFGALAPAGSGPAQMPNGGFGGAHPGGGW